MFVQIVVGSKSRLKRHATKMAAKHVGIPCTVIGMSTDSGIPEQPVGFSEGLIGATNRALHVASELKNVQRDDQHLLCLGIENYIELIDGGLSGALDIGAVALHEPVTDSENRIRLEPLRLYYATTESVWFPQQDVAVARSVGGIERSVTVGSVIAKRIGCDGADPHLALTGVSRAVYLEAAITNVLKQWWQQKKK
jgi:hypothetical protein